MLLRILTFFIGILFIILAVLGFMPEFFYNGKFLGVFTTNSLNNIMHLATGIIALLCGLKSNYASMVFFLVIGGLYGVLAIVGLFDSSFALFRFIATNMANSILYAIVALVSLYIGFATYRNRQV